MCMPWVTIRCGASPGAERTMPQKPVSRRFRLSGMGQGAGLQKPCDRRSARSRHDVALSEAGAMTCGQRGKVTTNKDCTPHSFEGVCQGTLDTPMLHLRAPAPRMHLPFHKAISHDHHKLLRPVSCWFMLEGWRGICLRYSA